MEKSYLYGASVQGIQSFIFQTNDLKSIVGASELVEKVCTKCFEKYANNGEFIVNAAGNVKYLFRNEEDCKRAYREFPKDVMTEAPGITISEAVVEVGNFKDAIQELERRLREQRNRRYASSTSGLMGMRRSKNTGQPVVKIYKDKYYDDASWKKIQSSIGGQNATVALSEKCFGADELSPQRVALNISDITDYNDWIAVVHADGNGIGNTIMGKNFDAKGLKEFSDNLSESTKKAAQKAYDDLIEKEKLDFNGKVIPIRPVVLGGDDFTFICKASLAIPFVTYYLKRFEKETKSRGLNLTACAGVAFIKSSYPFHYGYSLAEILCEESKRDAKAIAKKTNGEIPSCLMFHKVQSSFIEEYDEIVAKELITKDKESSLKFGPYYLHDQKDRWTISHLTESVDTIGLEQNGVSKSALRKWLGLLMNNSNMALQRKERVDGLLNEKDRLVFDEATEPVMRDGMKTYPAADILSLLTVETQVTRNNESEK